MEEYDPAPHPFIRWATRIARFVVCLILLATIVGAVYATCLPSLFYQQNMAAQAGNHYGPRP
jgi:hypothetical protein